MVSCGCFFSPYKHLEKEKHNFISRDLGTLTLGAAFLGFGSGLGGAGFCTKHT